MTSVPECMEPRQRVGELQARFAGPRVRVAALLCDARDPASVAFNIIGESFASDVLRYGALRADSERVAAGLAGLGVEPGGRVATLMGKSGSYLATLMGIWRMGAVHVPLFTAFAGPAIGERLARSGAKAVVCDSVQQMKLAPGVVPQGCRVITTGEDEGTRSGALRYRDLIESGPPGFEAVAVECDAPLIQIYTSGTTGSPKAVAVPVRALASFQAYAEFALDLRPDDVFWNAADPGWAYGLYFGILASLTTGIPGTLYEKGFSAEATFEILARYGVTNFTAAPTVYRALRASGLSPSKPLRLRCASSAGEPLTQDVNQWAVSVLGVEVYDHYGQTETGMLINNHHHPALRRPVIPGSMGQVMPGWSGTVLKPDSAEVAARGETGRVAMDLQASPLAWFRGYLDDAAKSAEKFSADGRWYLTGDLGRMDDQGNFYFASRDDDVIVMAGYRIGPFEVESTLAAHPAVSECAVVAVPDEIRGEVLEAVVVLRAGQSGTPELTSELQAWVRTRYAAHAYPRRIHYSSALPRTPSGKVQRFVIRQQLRKERMEATPCG